MFEVAKNFVLSFLKIEKFSKKDGKPYLKKEQKEQLTAEYGEQFVEKFEADLAANEATGEDPLHARLGERLGNLEGIVTSQKETIATLTQQNTELSGKVKKLEDEPEAEPAAEFVKNAQGKRELKFKINKNLAHNKIAAEFLAGDHRVFAAGESIDVDSVMQEFGELVNYVKLEMIQDIYQGFETSKDLTWKRGINSWKATRPLITKVVQQFVPKFTPLGDVTWTPLVIPLRRFKLNVLITPSDVEDWIYGMYDESKDLDQHPVTIYIINKLIVPQAFQDIDDIIANGTFVELDWSTVKEGDQGQDPILSIDGFLTQLRQQKALGEASKMNYIDLGEITDDNVVDKINFFVDNINKDYKKLPMPIKCDPMIYRKYKRKYKSLYGEGSSKGDDPNYGPDVVDYSRNILKPSYNMTDTGALFATPKINFIGLRHKNEPGATKLTLRKYDYDIHTLGEFRLGVGFAVAEAVFYYVPDDASGSLAGGGV